MNYTLREYLETLDEDCRVAIGCKSGTGFLYIGEAGNTELILRAFEDYRETVKERMNKAKGIINYHIMNPPALTGETDEENFDIILRRASYITENARSYLRSEKYIKGFISPMNRPVRERYHKDVDDCIAILIRGHEEGPYWTKSEFDADYKV